MSCSGFRAEGRPSEGIFVRPGNRPGRAGPRTMAPFWVLSVKAAASQIKDPLLGPRLQGELSPQNHPEPPAPQERNQNIWFSSSWGESF